VGALVAKDGSTRMKLYKGQRERVKLLAALLAVPLVLFLLPARFTAPMRIVFTEAVGPLNGAAFNVSGDVLASSGTLRDMFLAQEQRRAFEKEITGLRNKLAAATEELRARQLRLESVEGLSVKEPSFFVLSAAVTAYDSSPSHRSITIGAGASDGVREGLAVCASGALVGLIVEVGPWHSRARLITDAGSAIACRVSRTRRLCIVQGTGGEKLNVEWLDRDSQVRVGELLVSARLAHVGEARCPVPEGLPTAAVVEVRRNAAEPLFLWVSAAPRVNLGRLECVEILVPKREDAGT